MNAPKKTCPYCTRIIKMENKACASHRDLPALDWKQCMWKPK
jgi:hypothetical protein